MQDNPHKIYTDRCRQIANSLLYHIKLFFKQGLSLCLFIFNKNILLNHIMLTEVVQVHPSALV